MISVFDRFLLCLFTVSFLLSLSRSFNRSVNKLFFSFLTFSIKQSLIRTITILFATVDYFNVSRNLTSNRDWKFVSSMKLLNQRWSSIYIFSIGNSLFSKCTNLFVTNLNLLRLWICVLFLVVDTKYFWYLCLFRFVLFFFNYRLCWCACVLLVSFASFFFPIYCRYSHLTRALSTPLNCILNYLLGLELS